MKDKIIKSVALFVLMAFMSSCFQGAWAHYDHKSHYIHKRHFHRYRKHNRDW